MFKCCDCGAVFDHPKHCSEDRTPGGAFEGGSFIEHWDGCPWCDGAYEEAMECVRCEEEWVTDEAFCENCKQEICHEYTQLIEANFTEQEYDLITDLLWNPYMPEDKIIFPKSLERLSKDYPEDYLVNLVTKYVSIIKDNFREDEYDCTENADAFCDEEV